MENTILELEGKIGVWCHKTSTVEGHLHEVQAMGFEYLAIKIADGVHPYYPETAQRIATDAQTIDLPLVAWAYVYPTRIQEQIDVIKAALPPGVHHLILDAEVEWAGVDGSVAEALAHGIAEATGHEVTLHLSSFYNPDSHADIPYEAFLRHCQTFMPQVYVEGDTPLRKIMTRFIHQSEPMALHSLGEFVVPTINVPELLVPLKNLGCRSLSVWLWDGVQLSSGALRPVGADMGVVGYESAWSSVISKFKS